MVFLLVLILKSSPYSERYSAFWYFLGYIVFSSLPMLFVIFCLFGHTGELSFLNWGRIDHREGLPVIFLCILFLTKLPIFPFQAWLPVVHAESSSIVSVCLRGYVMKLGLLGLVRLC